MLQHVHSVLIGKDCPKSYTNVDALKEGDVAVFDENKNLITAADKAADAKALFFGVCEGKMKVTMPDGSIADKSKIEFSKEIQKNSPKVRHAFSEYEAPKQEEVELDLSAVKPIVGNRYVLKIVYKDIFEHPGQFTHTYEVIANSATPSDLINELFDRIAKHPNRRVDVKKDVNKLTLTALEKDDNDEVDSINEYSVIRMAVSLYTTGVNSFMDSMPKAVAGIKLTSKLGHPGKGYWKLVRDAEYKNMGYKGHVMHGAYPAIEQVRKVEKNAEYSYLTINHENLYVSNDNQYVKTTPIATELYVASGLKDSIVMKAFDAFLNGIEPAAAEVQG